MPLHAGGADRSVIGVLEVYMPYAPIRAAYASSERRTIAVMVAGLVVLWLALGAITWSATRRLRRSAAANERLARFDPLTTLPNRREFLARVDAAHRAHERGVVAIVDVDRFQEVNDTLGHHNGDDYLRVIAERLRREVRDVDTVARIGADEFGLVLVDTDREDSRAVLERVQGALARDVDVAGVPLSTEASIGVAAWPYDASDADDLVQCADVAMHAGKQSGGGEIVEYASGLSHFSPERLALVSDLRRAIARDELVLHYQPQIDVMSGAVLGVEALVRWEHPLRGLLLPAEFIPVAECTGLMRPLTRWVPAHAVAQLAQWHAEGLALGVSVNVSARNLRDDDLADHVVAVLAANDIAPEWLEIEITETALVADPARARLLLQRWRDHGVRVALDDFGQGQTSLGQLGHVPLTCVKIDRAFVAAMVDERDAHVIVSTVCDLGHRLDLTVVAEGVESRAVLDALAAIGCDAAQGYAISPPLPAHDVAGWCAVRAHRPLVA